MEDEDLHTFRHRVVSVFHAAAGRAAGECVLHCAEYVAVVTWPSGLRKQSCGPGVTKCLLRAGAISAFDWGQWKARGTPNHFAFLIGKHSFESIRIDYLFTLIRRHGTQIADRRRDLAPAVSRKLPHLVEDLARLMLLFGSQVLPGFHTVQDVELLLRRKARETLQPVTEHLLPI